MSNVFRAQLKKLGKNKANKAKSGVNVGSPTVVEKGKKKALSVSSPPELSPNHGHTHHPVCFSFCVCVSLRVLEGHV